MGLPGLPTGSTQGSGSSSSTAPTTPQVTAALWDALNQVLSSGGSVNINISFGPTPTVNG